MALTTAKPLPGPLGRIPLLPGAQAFVPAQEEHGKARFTGLPVQIRYGAHLEDMQGNAAHASTYLRQRLIILDHGLRGNKTEHERILLHEIFHFAWVRLGNPRRWEWEGILRAEWDAGARGETAWSAQWRKEALRERDARARNAAWREYCCESYCDTAAWVCGGSETELTLAARWRAKRKVWFHREFATRTIAL